MKDRWYKYFYKLICEFLSDILTNNDININSLGGIPFDIVDLIEKTNLF